MYFLCLLGLDTRPRTFYCHRSLARHYGSVMNMISALTQLRVVVNNRLGSRI